LLWFDAQLTTALAKLCSEPGFVTLISDGIEHLQVGEWCPGPDSNITIKTNAYMIVFVAFS